jgi:hypothetical protein
MINDWAGPMIAAGVAVVGLPAWIWVIWRIAHGGKGWLRRRSRNANGGFDVVNGRLRGDARPGRQSSPLVGIHPAAGH